MGSTKHIYTTRYTLDPPQGELSYSGCDLGLKGVSTKIDKQQ
jgi:hypothetical protein